MSQQAATLLSPANAPQAMIPQSFNEAFERVSHLASVFKENEHQYLAPSYSEAQARIDFIDKFWVALGWDVNHERQTNPYEQEVKVERGVAMGAGRKRADYAFFAPNFRDVLFYVEAKKPKAELDNILDYFQTIRYGWNGRTPLAVLTDFEHFRVLDCRYKPDLVSALDRAVKKFYYADYFDPEKFAELYYLFSREAARNGSLEKYTETLERPPRKARQRTLFGGGFKSIDESFLEDLDEDREELARAFAKDNPQLDSYELTEVTQRTLDRLVFMRFLEDKLIEPEPIVESLGSGGSSWQGFVATSHRLDRIYNGIIFKKHALLDASTFKVDEAAFDNVRTSLAHTISPYDFNAIPIHILGSIYERFLGKIITVTNKGAQVEEKPEVRKAGGVYYTPEYIVRYIVEKTVGKLIKGKRPEEISQMRFADIACGSGSFLLGVYDLLLRHHAGYYNANKTNRTKGLKAGCTEREDGTLQLSLLQRRNILLNSIYGVDVDPQAVEVAQLSLYLKLLEDETIATSQRYQMELREALLPNLNSNIICGNSLIGWDILEGHLFEPEEERKLNPMDFENAFPQVMGGGGFDAIVGNPPYGAEANKVATDYFRANFKTARKSLDTYALFMEQALKLLKPGGKFSMIVPTGWYSGVRFSFLRRLMACATDPETFINLPYDVFDAWVDTSIFVATKRHHTTTWPRAEDCEVQLRTFPKRHKIVSEQEFNESLQVTDFIQWFTEDSDEYLTYADFATTLLMRKIQNGSKTLQEFADVQRGVTPFELTDQPTHATSRRAFDGTVRRYFLEHKTVRYIRFDETLAEPKPERYFTGERLLLRELISRQFRLQAVKAAEDFVTNKSMQSILPLQNSPDLNFLLGVINSRLMSWYFLRRSNIAQRDDFPKIVLKETRLLPVPELTPNDAADKVRHDRLTQLVEQLLTAKQQLAAAHTDRDKNFYERKCSGLDQQIDKLVYELYRLTDEEITLIEAGQS
ncbi:MAG: N-6 DNA methylase [Chitinophagaceae bacterium]